MTISAPLPRFENGVPFEQTIGRFHDFTSGMNGRDYRVFVDIPEGDPPAGGHPTLYLLDGNLHFAPAVGMARGLAMAGELRPGVIVGIGYQTTDPLAGMALRFRDLSLPASEAWIAGLGWSAPGMSAENTGGVDDFIEVLEREIRPAIAALTKVDPADQALFGHSLAGHAVLHALFTSPGSYRSFIASSPSIWWANNAVLAGEDAFRQTLANGAVQSRLLLAVGALEAFPDRAAIAHFKTRAQAQAVLDHSRMVDNVVELGARLANAPGLSVSTNVFAGEGHATVIPAVLCRALQFALGLD